MTKELFLKRVYKTDHCWFFIGGVDKNGYGKICYRRKDLRAHRVSYRIFNGKIKSGLLVCHKCDIPGCVNPEHLFLGNNSENVKDCVNKGMFNSGFGNFHRRKTHCPQGHPYSGKNLRIKKCKKDGKPFINRLCKICGRAAVAKRRYG